MNFAGVCFSVFMDISTVRNIRMEPTKMNDYKYDDMMNNRHTGTLISVAFISFCMLKVAVH